VLGDETVVKGSEKFVRIIIRRPHAYSFKAKYKEAPIPGVVVLDGDGGLKAKHDLKGEDAAQQLAEMLKKYGK